MVNLGKSSKAVLISLLFLDLLLEVKAQEILGFQKNQVLFSELLAFGTVLNNVYETSCPSPEDYANRRDMIRIFNEIAKEMYGKFTIFFV